MINEILKECPFTPSCMTSKRLMKKKPSRICKNSNEFLWNQRDSSWHISWCVYENNDNAYKYCIRLGCLGIKSPNGKIIWPNSLEFVKFGELAQSSSREIWKKNQKNSLQLFVEQIWSSQFMDCKLLPILLYKMSHKRVVLLSEKQWEFKYF